MKKIVVLDGYAANPADLSWDELKKQGEVTVYDRTHPDQLMERAIDADIVLTNKVVIDADMMKALPNLKYIGVLATGYNVVDVTAAHNLGITVTNIPAYSTDSVAQMAFAHILNITQRVGHYSEDNSKGRWSENADFCYWDTPLMELSGKTIGIIGLGNTGSATAKIALTFGMKVKAFTSKEQSSLPAGIEKASLDDIFSTSEIVSLHCPLTDNTKNLVDSERLRQMKKSAILINTGRGPLVDEEALAEALNSDVIYAAGLDVLSSEPPKSDNPLLKARNCFITPHIAWATKEARIRLMEIAVDNVAAFIDGHPQNTV
ncbi:MAG: D-2-hydroxyacid dehydrogenase [Muribaculaceae bacterium]|nr:D-2-hydroxyacid dehydrogenase [Muribaculaceae bacterium]